MKLIFASSDIKRGMGRDNPYSRSKLPYSKPVISESGEFCMDFLKIVSVKWLDLSASEASLSASFDAFERLQCWALEMMKNSRSKLTGDKNLRICCIFAVGLRVHFDCWFLFRRAKINTFRGCDFWDLWTANCSVWETKICYLLAFVGECKF